jgi:Skp family chaperone for outer membrane proteins
MYRIEDLEKIKANLDKIQDEAANEYKKNNEPNLEEIGKVYSAIKDFIKRNGIYIIENKINILIVIRIFIFYC